MAAPIDLHRGQRWATESDEQEARITRLGFNADGHLVVCYDVRSRRPGGRWDRGYRVLASYFRRAYPRYL